MSRRVYEYVRQHHLALVAVFLALTGTAVALPGKNKVDSGDIKKGQVKSSDLARDSVSSPNVVDDTLTGADITEDTLGQVPNAQNAASAQTAGNAEMLDGLNSSAFAPTEHNHDSTYVNEGQADSVSAGMINNLTRSVPVPLASFIDCQTASGAFLDFDSSVGAALADFNNLPSFRGFTIRFDADPGNADQGTLVCSQVTAPPDYVSDGRVRTRVSKPTHTAPNREVMACSSGVNGGDPAGSGGTFVDGTTSQSLTCPPASSPIAPGDTVAFNLRVSSPGGGTMDDPLDVHSVDFTYTAAQ